MHEPLIASHALRTGPALRRRPTAMPRAWILLAVLGTSAAATVAAQSAAIENSPISIPLADGAMRRRDLEHKLEAAAGDGRTVVVYRWEGPMEPLVRYYIQHLAGERDADVDSSSVRPGGVSTMSYHLEFYTLEDQCADSTAAPAAATAAPCTHWKRAKDLKRSLLNRLPMAPGAWVRHCVFTWFSRDDSGTLTRWSADVFDSGLTDDWRHYMPKADLIIESQELKGTAPARAPQG